jgi:hypothetical protein
VLDVLLLPALLMLALGLRAVRRGDHRLHGHLMSAAFTLVGLRVLLFPRELARLQLTTWLVTAMAAGTTVLLGRKALAWREGRSTQAFLPRLHRASGAATLMVLALTTIFWLLRNYR